MLPDREAAQRRKDPVRRGERLLVRRQQEPRAEAVSPEDLSGLVDKAAADGDLLNGAFVCLPAGAAAVAVNERVKICHGGASFLDS